MKKSALIITVAAAILLICCSGSKKPNSESSIAAAFGSSERNFKKLGIEDMVFVGDSNTSHLVYYKLVPRSRVWTGKEEYLSLAPDTYRRYIVADGEEMTVAEAAKREKPLCMVITLGTDGAATLDREGVRLSYSSLIESVKKASPGTKIALQSIFPVREGIINTVFTDPAKTNAKFREVNTWLSELAEEYGALFIDSSDVLCDENGELREEYNSDHLDGYHLNRAGLSAMLGNVLRTVNGETQ